MAEKNKDSFDDLNAFFSAAINSDTHVMKQAAENVAGTGRNTAGTDTGSTRSEEDDWNFIETIGHPTNDHATEGFSDLDGKFIAIDPENVSRASGTSDQPFVLVPAKIHSLLPWWAWTTIALGLSTLAAGIIIVPEISTSRLISRLDGKNEAEAQAIMRQLLLRGGDRIVSKLYDMASANQPGISSRLRAVDTLGLMRNQSAERALLRLELARETDERIREAAIAARRQREAAKTRTGTP